MAKFKKGDRVKIVELGLVHQSLGIAAGSVGTVEEDGSMHPYVTFDGRVGLVAVAETRLEILLPVAEATGKPSLTIETGKYYRTRDGRKVGPMRRQAFGWVASKRIIATDQCDWYEGGNFSRYRDREHDLVAEWVDEPSSNDNSPSTTPAIVALIENGQPKPSDQTKVHKSEQSATDEAERLAVKYPGQKFGVFVLADSRIADVVIRRAA